MTAYKKIEQAGTNAVKRLREKKLHSGHPFMINSHDLPADQCYLEYPDGTIKLVSVSPSAKDFMVIRQLSKSENLLVRSKFHLADA